MQNRIILLFLLTALTLAFPCFSQISKSRNINLSIATIFNHPYISNQNSSDRFTSNKTTPGYSIELGIDSAILDWLRLDFAINFNQYNTNFSAIHSGLAGGTSTQVDITKSTLGIVLYPFRIIRKNVRFQFGFEYSRLINEQFSGYVHNSFIFKPPTNYDLNKIYSRYSYFANFGIRLKAGYTFRLNNHIAICPYYSLFWTGWMEYEKAPFFIKSIRNSFGLTCLKSFN